MHKRPAGSSPPLNESDTGLTRRFFSRLRSRVVIGIVIFLIAFSVRVLTWHDTRLEVRNVQTVVVADYQRVAHSLREGGVSSFFSRSSALGDLNNLGHPPGYSVLIALVYSLKQSNGAIQFVQIAADAFSAVIIFLIVVELLSSGAGIAAGLLAALSPQLAWNSVLLLPDSISVLPILLAVYLLARAVKNPRLTTFFVIGVLIGLSCWLRANAMLLTLFFAAAGLLLCGRQRWHFGLAVICGTLLIVLPLTIRNAIVFHRFIPLSLGAGQTFLEGIADYDKQGRFGIPDTDMGIMKQEAGIYQRPDYYGTLFNPDGVERERARLSRGFGVVRSHPFWFAGVMTKRASSMLRLERSRLTSTEPPITHAIDELTNVAPATTIDPEQMFLKGAAVPGARAIPSNGSMPLTESTKLELSGNEEKYGPQFLAPWIDVKSGTDYVVTVPAWISAGRMRVSVVNASYATYSSQVIEPLVGLHEEWRKMHAAQIREMDMYDSIDPTEDQPEQLLKLPFVAVRDERIRVVCSNEASNVQSRANIGFIKLHQLGPARYVWTRYPRIIINAIQKLFLTAVILPPAVIGLLILILRKQTSALLILSVVPIYFFSVQSAFHTEYRYVIAVTYFLFAFAGIAIGCGFDFVAQKLRLNGARASLPA
jgi:hypothetical protein